MQKLPTYSLTQGREYYGPSLASPKAAPQTMWTDRPAEDFYEKSHGNKGLWFAAGTAALIGSGFLPSLTTSGGRMWDDYVRFIRGVEEYSPGAVLRTFQASTFFSQYTSRSKEAYTILGSTLKEQKPLLEYLTKLIGEKAPTGGGLTYERLMQEGVEFRGGQLFFGKGDVALKYASNIFSPENASQHFGRGYAYTVGASGKGFSELLEGVDGKLGTQRQIIGAQTRAGYIGRQVGAWATEGVSRFNRLLAAPFEMEPFRTVFGGAQNLLKKATGYKLQFAVAEGTASQMLGRLAFKYGVGAGAIAMGYKTIDYLMRDSSLLEGTAFDEGLTAGLATGVVEANMMASKIAETTGLQDYREWQEEWAPGSTSLQRLLAFPLMGGLGAAGLSFGWKTMKQMEFQRAGMTAAEARHAAIKSMETFRGPLSGLGEALTKTTGLYGRQDWIGAAFRKITTPVQGGPSLRYKFLGKLGPTKLAGLVGAAAGAALILPFLPGALIPEKSPEELEDIYSGRQEVAIRKGRWWEFGRSKFEGGRVKYYRPHWYPRMMMRAREKSLYGEEEEHPFTRYLKNEFTYDFEQEHYYDRPYPVTSLPFEDIPLVGPLLANTIGRLIKPPKLMHTEEWMGEGGAVKAPPARFGERVATEIGELPARKPVSPHGVEGALGEQIYRLEEMAGLLGFSMMSVQEKLHGTPDMFDQKMQLESARRAFGFERMYWDLELGGLMGNTEAFRRLYPHRRRQIPLYNPIRNTMPGWLPGAGEKSPDFLHGDPYCIASETLVEVQEGSFKRVCELTTDDRIRTHTGKWVQPKKIVKRNMRPGEKLFEIKVTSLSVFPVRASEEHPFWTEDGWIEAKDLEVGNYVGYPLPELDDLLVDDGDQLLDLALYCDLPANSSHIFLQGSQEYADCIEFIEKNPGPYQRGERKQILDNHGWSAKTFENAQRGLKNGSLNRIPRRINPWCAEWGLLSGYYVAEGSSCRESVSFAFHKNEKVYQGQVLDALYYLFGLKGSIYPNSKGNGVQVIVTNKALAQILPRIFGTNSYNKRLPLWIGSFIPALSALFNGDGSFFFDQDKPRLSLKSKSQKLLWSVRQFLLLWGFVGSIIEDNLVYSGQAAKDCAQFIHTLKYQDCPDSSRLSRHTYIKNGYVWMRVFSKKEIPQELVYGIEVDVDDSFCVVGIATHNTKVQEGELRLPGKGYEARFPELEGISPEDYPLIHQYKILADVAPYSDKFKLALQEVRSARKRDTWTDYEEKVFRTTQDQLTERKKRKEFQEYEYLSPMGEIFSSPEAYGADGSSSMIAAINRMKATQTDEPGLIQKTFGGYWELLSHNAETALDNLTPVAPGAKLVHRRTAIEDYEKTQLYGTENAFWNHPMRDFIRPFTRLAGKAFGYTATPGHVEERRALEETFDVLEYVKAARLANMARMAGDSQAVKAFEAKKDETLFGVNPFTFNYRSIYRALPRRERDYFQSFAAASTTEERAKILDMVPDNEKPLYIARWKMALAEDVRKAMKGDMLSEGQVEEAEAYIESVREEAKTEGFPTSKELFAEYVETRLEGESYADWYRRTRLLAEKNLPGADWCFPTGTLVLTETGYKPIEQIKTFERVLTRNGWKYVLNNISREIKEEIVELTWSQDTCHKLQCTIGHPIYLNNKFIQAKEAQIGDKLEAVNWNEPECHGLNIMQYLPEDHYKQIQNQDGNYFVISSKPGPSQKRPHFLETTDDFYWMLGWFLAEGNIRYSDNRWRGIEFTLSLDKEDIARRLVDVLEKVFLKKPKLIKRYRNTGNSISVILNQQIAAHVMYRLCGRYSNKKAPSFPGSLRQHKIAADAYLQGDGSFKNNRAVLNTTSINLALWFRDIQIASGNNVSYRCQKRSNRKDQHRISILSTPQKDRIVTSVKLVLYEGKVHNLQVEGSNEFYVISGLVHNCGWHPSVDLEDIKLKIVQNMGEDMHEYDLWPSRAIGLGNKPYINNEAIEPLVSPEDMDDDEIRARINEVLVPEGVEVSTFIRTTNDGQDSIDVDIEQDHDLDELAKGLA